VCSLSPYFGVFVSTYASSLPDQPQKMNSSQTELNDNWTKVSYKKGRSTQDGTDKEAKHVKQREHRLSPTSTSNLYTALLEEES
jgi:hypothetical protein